MRRRAFLSVPFVLLAGGNAHPQAQNRRIGVLSAGDSSSIPSSLRDSLRQGLRDGGFIEGRNLAIDWRFGEDSGARLGELAADLVRSKVDLIFAINTPAALAAKGATSSVPVLFIRVADPVGVGLAASLARPGGNATGFVPFTPELAGKRLAMLKDLLPGLARVAVLYMLSNPGAALTFKQTEAAAAKLGLTVASAGVASTAAFAPAIEAAARNGAGALMVIDDVVISSNQRDIVDMSLKNRLPLSSIYREFAESGALIAYGPNPVEMYRGAADYAARILRGANPAELPVQQPARFELIVNLKTANALKLSIPQSVLTNADTIIR